MKKDDIIFSSSGKQRFDIIIFEGIAVTIFTFTDKWIMETELKNCKKGYNYLKNTQISYFYQDTYFVFWSEHK